MESYPIRTDLALESQERLKKDRGNVRGIRFFEEKRKNGIIVSTVVINTENAAKAMGRPKGTYVTIEAPEMINSIENKKLKKNVENSLYSLGSKDGRINMLIIKHISKKMYYFNRIKMENDTKVLRATYSLRTKGGKQLIVLDRRKVVELDSGKKSLIGMISDITSKNLDMYFES